MSAWFRVLTVLTVAAVLATGCGDEDGGGVAAEGGLDGRTFLSQDVTEGGVDRPLVPGTTIRLEFVEGEVRVHAGCNHLFGVVTSTANGRLEIGEMGGTEMGCDAERHGQDQWVMDLLTSTPTWAVEGDELVITAGSTILTLLDRRVADPDRPLEGTRWVVDTILQGDTAMSMPTEAVAELVFTDGAVSGSTGCNEISGSYRFDGSVLDLDPFVQTDAACSPDVMILEDAVLALSGSSVEVDIVASRLTLVGADGRGLGLYAAD